MEVFRRLQSTCAAATILVFACTSHAQVVLDEAALALGPIPDRLIPVYTECTYQNSRFACFTEEQTRELFILEVRAKHWHAQWVLLSTLEQRQNLQIKVMQHELDVRLTMSLEDQKHINILNDKVVDEIEAKNKWRSKAENPPTWPLWVGGSVGILGLGAFLGSLVR